MTKYQHLFFDLDHTLWDTDKNSAETLVQLYHDYNLKAKGIENIQEFISNYNEINIKFWMEYAMGRMNKEKLRFERFKQILAHYNINDYDLSYALSDKYVQLAPNKPHLQPYAKEILMYLKDKYSLHIITNGFTDTQFIKLKSSGIDTFFKQVITSDYAGAKKPSPTIFNYAVNKARATIENSIMIGDNLEVDVLGAKNMGMDQVYYNVNNTKHEEVITHEIKSLLELKHIL